MVKIIFEHMPGDAVVEECCYLPHRVTGKTREVDVVIRSTIAGLDVIVSVEATRGGRRATVEWVERMLKKHEYLSTSKLVLVSGSGFTPDARKEAEAEGAVPLTPEDLNADDPALGVLLGLKSLWPKELKLVPEEAALLARRPDGSLIGMPNAKENLNLGVFLADGQPFGDLIGVVKLVYDENFATVAEGLGLSNVTEDIDGRSFNLVFRPPSRVDGEEKYLYLRMEEGDTHELLEIEEAELRGKAIVHVCEIPLHQRRLGEVSYAYGEGMLGDEPVMAVVSEGKATVRSRPER
jgi:hypothetical protein